MDIHPDTVFDQLEREWDHLLRSGLVERRLAGWRSQPALAGFDDVGQLLDRLADPAVADEHKDAVLLALLRLAPRDRLAGRLVLQRFVAPLKTIAGWEQPLPQCDWAAQVVSTAYEVIATYPVDRRPSRVGANIVWDVRKRSYAALADDRRWHEQLSDPTDTARRGPTDDTSAVDAAELLSWAVRRAGLSRDVAGVILLTRTAGFRLDEVAERLGVPCDRLRQRRWRAEQRLRGVLAAAS